MAEKKPLTGEEPARERDEILQVLRDDRDAWNAVASGQPGVLLGERKIVVDSLDRAYSTFVHDGKSQEGLSQVNHDLVGVIKLNDDGAARVRVFLEQRGPGTGPYVVWDFQEYARTQAERSQKLIDDITRRVTTADAPRVIRPEAMSVIEYKLKTSGASAAPDGLSPSHMRGMASGYLHALEMMAVSPKTTGGPTTLHPEGVAVIEQALRVADAGDPAQAPFPLLGEEAKDYLRGLAQAYRESLKELAGLDSNAKASSEVDSGASAIREQYRDLLFAIHDGWGVVHSKGDARLKETWGRLIRENGDFADQSPTPSPEYNARLYAALDAGKNLILSSWVSQTVRNKVGVALEKHDQLRGQWSEPGAGFLLLEITNTSNAAFVDVGRDAEVARIIREAADQSWPSDFASVNMGLRDVNGNRVGSVTHVAEAPVGDPADGAVRLSIKSDAVSPSADAGIALARVLKDVAHKVARGEHVFAVRDDNGGVIAEFELREPPSYVKDGVLNIAEALKSGNVYMADDGFSGLAEGEFRYVVPGPEFTPGYHQHSGEAWLVNAKGEIASGYEDGRIVRELEFHALTHDESVALRAVIEGRVSFEEHERSFGGGDDVEPD